MQSNTIIRFLGTIQSILQAKDILYQKILGLERADTPPPSHLEDKGKTDIKMYDLFLLLKNVIIEEKNVFLCRFFGFSYSFDVNCWVFPWLMAYVNSISVQRSNAHVGYAPYFKYCEMAALPLLSGIAFYIWFVLSLVFAVFPVLKMLVPGELFENPSRKKMIKGAYKITFVAKNSIGNKCVFVWDARGDAGNISTVILLGECAVCLTKRGCHASYGGPRKGY